MYATVCDICGGIIVRNAHEVINGDKCLFTLQCETELYATNYHICFECFQKIAREKAPKICNEVEMMILEKGRYSNGKNNK